ncbi:hypothetical protein [Hymenobacter bucti]|uniref:Uncharacterized protein n=1 Tax=Hymenobacter bucti TaxID=1844114 RepID=A0ABW4QZZ2_9BACT
MPQPLLWWVKRPAGRGSLRRPRRDAASASPSPTLIYQLRTYGVPLGMLANGPAGYASGHQAYGCTTAATLLLSLAAVRRVARR